MSVILRATANLSVNVRRTHVVAFHPQTILHHVFLWGSIGISFVWFAVFGEIRGVFWEMYKVPFVTMATREFWAVCALSAVAALLPRYC